jgi:hypothetical protein
MAVRVTPSPSAGVPVVNLDDNSSLVESKLGAWILEGKIIQDLVVETSQIRSSPVPTDTSKNIKVSDSDGVKVSITTLYGADQTKEARKAAYLVSTFLEKTFGVTKGSLSGAHRKGSHIVRRHLAYERGADAPAHADGSGYTLLFTQGPLELYDPFDHDRPGWIALPALEPNMQCYLLLGRYFSCPPAATSNSTRPHAPIHRVAAAVSTRTSVAISVNADECWSGESLDKNPSDPSTQITGSIQQETTNELLMKDMIDDAETCSRNFLQTHVPSVDEVWQHWTLLCAIVNGGGDAATGRRDDGCLNRLPSVDCTAYWQLQTGRYLDFLNMHQLHPEQAESCLPPRQIHHVWLCHMLQPLEYRDDCKELLGRVLPHDNSTFDLQGCEQFHALWNKVTGQRWPSADVLAEEAREARSGTSLEKVEATLDHPLRANFWKGYDGLEAILDSVRVDAPSVVDAKDECETTRANYARYVTAASFAPNIAMAPGCAMDLVWHAHQTNPQGYQRAMDSLPRFLNHNPCGKLNPPCEQWERDSQRVWRALYGRGIDLPGQSIGCCCTPMDERPTSPVVINDTVCWFFPQPRSISGPFSIYFGHKDSYPSQNLLYCWLSEFPTRPSDDRSKQLSVDFQNAFNDANAVPPIPVWLTILDYILCAICFLTLGCFGIYCCIFSWYIEKYPDHHIQKKLVSDFQERFRELGMGLDFERYAVGPPPPSGHDVFKGPAFLFRNLEMVGGEGESQSPPAFNP